MEVKIRIKIYNRRTLVTWIDFDCLMKILLESFSEFSEIAFVEMSDTEKRCAEGDTVEFGIVDVVSPFRIESVHDDGTVEFHPDLERRLKVEGNRNISIRDS